MLKKTSQISAHFYDKTNMQREKRIQTKQNAQKFLTNYCINIIRNSTDKNNLIF